MSIKDRLKSIVTERLRDAASSIFIGRALAVLDESADTKESLLCAADSISKRVALFIDTVLAKEIFDILTIEIENRVQTPGTRRKHERVNFMTKAQLMHNGATSELFTANLSLGGIYLRTPEPFAVGSKVELSLPLEGGGLSPVERYCDTRKKRHCQRTPRHGDRVQGSRASRTQDHNQPYQESRGGLDLPVPTTDTAALRLRRATMTRISRVAQFLAQ